MRLITMAGISLFAHLLTQVAFYDDPKPGRYPGDKDISGNDAEDVVRERIMVVYTRQEKDKGARREKKEEARKEEGDPRCECGGENKERRRGERERLFLIVVMVVDGEGLVW